ncbi:MAG TPA: hypothetical protein ENK33_03030 [Desulfobacterales bacterium]|nr:hypothetical protein [Desulfobacterales bacterium]
MKKIILLFAIFFLPGFVHAGLRPLSRIEAVNALQNKTFQAHSLKEQYNYRIYYSGDGLFTLYYQTATMTAVIDYGKWSVDDKGTYCLQRKIHKHKFTDCGRIYQSGNTLYLYNNGELKVTLEFIGNGSRLEKK